MNNTNNHIEELVDRFVTNTATQEETDELFDAIAENPELGNSLATASRLQVEFDRDLALIDVPAGLYESIVAAAPFPAVPVGAAASSSAASVASVSSSSSVISIALGAASGLAALSVMVFTAITLFTGNGADIQGTQDVYAGAPPTPTKHEPAQPGPDAQPGPQAAVTLHVPTAPATPTPRADVSVPSEHPMLITAAPTQSYITTPSQSSTQTPSQTHTESYSETYSETSTESSTESPTQSFTVRIQQRPITSTSSSQTTSTLTNLGLETSLTVARDLSLGVGLYHDVFPMRVVQSGGDTTSTESMYWGGVHARWQPAVTLPFELGVFAQLTMGGSSRGVITQPSLGVTKQLGLIELGLGIDCSAFAFQNNGVWNMTLQPGLRATLDYRF